MNMVISHEMSSNRVVTGTNKWVHMIQLHIFCRSIRAHWKYQQRMCECIWNLYRFFTNIPHCLFTV